MKQPYFYIIEHISGKRYAGIRYKDGCDPDELLQPNGYHTSSDFVKQIIGQYGLESFKVMEIVMFDSVDELIEHETDFLVSNNCADNISWLNLHNNTNKPPPYGSPSFRKIMEKKYGEEVPLRIPEFLKKSMMVKTEKYGDPTFSNPEKAVQTRLVKYSEENGGYEEVNNKRHQTNVEKFGEDYGKYFQEKGIKACVEKYGDHPSRVDSIRKRKAQTNMEKYGVDNPAKSEEIQEKIRKTNLERTGYTTSIADPEVRERSKKVCPHCNKRIDAGNYAQHHGDKCKHRKDTEEN